jgi:predicted SnoaL-like aldol condensation-catalyzing enzyme
MATAGGKSRSRVKSIPRGRAAVRQVAKRKVARKAIRKSQPRPPQTTAARLAANKRLVLAFFVKFFRENFPEHRYEVKKVLAEGDMVVLHLHGMGGMNPYGEQVVDFFRVQDGKVVEHWDVIQPIPEKSDNPNGVF